ncbi:MAG: GPW/gp25 family protein [Cyanobacteriota bacterium]|nr:GPW/gp25 family protein [Cyanobacteriota bacterium]
MSQLRGTQNPAGFLGRGWAFPPRFSPGGAAVAMVSDEEDIHQSLGLLFATRRGERLMQEDYGASLEEWLYAEVDNDLVANLCSAIEEAVLLHEPRIQLLEVNVNRNDQLDGVLDINIEYLIPATNSRFNMVFPFYLNEATALIP